MGAFWVYWMADKLKQDEGFIESLQGDEKTAARILLKRKKEILEQYPSTTDEAELYKKMTAEEVEDYEYIKEIFN